MNIRPAARPTRSATSGVIAGIENVTTGAANDSLKGDSVSNSLDAGSGNDTILGDSGLVQYDAQGGNLAFVQTYTQPSAGGGTVDLGGTDTTVAEVGIDTATVQPGASRRYKATAVVDLRHELLCSYRTAVGFTPN